MGLPSTSDHQNALLRLVCAEHGPWLLLHLPDGQYAPFWKQGIGTNNCIAVAEGRYADAVPMSDISRLKVVQYMATHGE